jgi:hypothetical protein
MATATATKHACARCGKKDVAERMVFSTFTRNRYCRDMTACDKRFKRRTAP